ncbi:MAG: response regulator [Bryobacteraceae bacterium]
MARVLVVDDDPASRLTLQTLLEAGGYSVDSAASAAEAVGKLDERQYELVLSDLGMESPDAGYRVLHYARHLAYRPATALVTTEKSSTAAGSSAADEGALVEPEGVPDLLDHVAHLISERATRRMRRTRRLS